VQEVAQMCDGWGDGGDGGDRRSTGDPGAS